MNTNKHKRTIASGLCALLAVLAVANGCGRNRATNRPPETDKVRCERDDGCGKDKLAQPVEPRDESGHRGHGDGHGKGQSRTPSASIEERASAKCEHNVPIYQCAECRYEAGVVKVESGLLKRTNGNGLVRTQIVERSKVSTVLSTTGDIALNENASAHVSPRVAGIVETVAVDVGARVKLGDTLFSLTSLELGKALAEYERNRTLTELSRKVFARESKLREQKVGSDQDVIDAQIAFEQHRTDLKASEQALRILGLTEEDLMNTNAPSHGPAIGRLSVRAPMAGTVIEKHAVRGEMVEAGKNLMFISDLSSVWVWANVQSRDLAALLTAEKHGPAAVEVTVSAFPDRQFNGTLDYVSATMDEQTRTVRVRATVANPDLALRPGMFCEAAISTSNGQSEEVLVAPRAAVLSDEGTSFVFKHWKDDFFVRQNVRKGREFSGMVEIRDGLNPGDTVIAEGAFLLKSDVLREKMGAGCAD